MKKIFVIIASLLVIQSEAQFKQATLQASGLTCAMCSKAIYKSLEKLVFAEKIQSNIKESSFTITFKQNEAVDFDAIRKAVEDAGFAVANLKVTANFNDVSVANDSHVVVDGKSLHFLNVKSQVLKGDNVLQVIDKKFVSDKVYNKYAAATKMQCFTSGVMENTTGKQGQSTATRIYHVTI
ncbi:MAG: heavy-metal-associated domain-containing protein [Chitinophagaceae bacterium]|nr:heavy-metal-associated domain-containing protein [Chitinophagaceae bacterium]